MEKRVARLWRGVTGWPINARSDWLGTGTDTGTGTNQAYPWILDMDIYKGGTGSMDPFIIHGSREVVQCY